MFNTMRFVIFGLALLIAACASPPDSSSSLDDAQPKQVLNYAKADADYIALAQKIINRSATKQDFDRIIRLFPLTSFYQPTSATD